MKFRSTYFAICNSEEKETKDKGKECDYKGGVVHVIRFFFFSFFFFSQRTDNTLTSFLTSG